MLYIQKVSLWATLVIIVPKKPDPSNHCKQQLLLVLDYRALNEPINAAHNGNSVISYYPLPNIMDLLARLQNCTMFSSLDLRPAYHHISLTPQARPKTVFAITSGKWCWDMAPFDICSFLGVFCYLRSHVLPRLDSCFVYPNNILIYSSSWKEHLQHLEVVFKCLKEANLKLKSSKCKFLKKHLHYLGYLISKQGIQLLPKTVSAIQHIQEPSNMEELQYFLGLTGYYRTFFLLFADITKPLNKLLRKATKFQWSLQCQAALII